MSYSYSTCYCRECECMDLSDRSRYDNIKAWCSARRTYINPMKMLVLRILDMMNLGNQYQVVT